MFYPNLPESDVDSVFFGVILNKNYAYNQLLNAIMPLGRAL